MTNNDAFLTTEGTKEEMQSAQSSTLFNLCALREKRRALCGLILIANCLLKTAN
jgi:hypothetical protein